MNELLNRITQIPGQCGGRLCIRGMRIRVSDILEMLFYLGICQNKLSQIISRFVGAQGLAPLQLIGYFLTGSPLIYVP